MKQITQEWKCYYSNVRPIEILNNVQQMEYQRKRCDNTMIDVSDWRISSAFELSNTRAGAHRIVCLKSTAELYMQFEQK